MFASNVMPDQGQSLILTPEVTNILHLQKVNNVLNIQMGGFHTSKVLHKIARKISIH